MNYTVSRNGQSYGPYTMDDLRRYLATGNVLPTDLAQSESMPNAIPVAQLLASLSPPAAPPAMQPAPPSGREMPPDSASPFTAPSPLQPPAPMGSLPGYAPGLPQPYGSAYPRAFNPNAFPDAPDLNWVILLAICFIFNPFWLVWDFVLAAWLRRVQPGSKALLWYSISAGVAVLLLIGFVAFIAVATQHPDQGSTAASVVFALLLLAALLGIFVLQIVARFSERASLLEHFNGPEPVGLRLSGVMTFFFGSLYFQYHLNRIKKNKDAMRFGQPRPY